MKDVQITIGIPSGGTIRTETTSALIAGIIDLMQKDTAPNILFQIGGYVDYNRNKIVEESLKRGTTHLMFIDADMIFPADGIDRLLQHNKDIVGANYNVRLDPTSKVLSGPTVKMLVDGQPVSMAPGGLPEDLFKCYALPTGFMLINMDVFKKLRKPYFDAHQKGGKHYTEDVQFCMDANKAGIEVWCDPKIQMGHIGSYVY